MTSATTRVSRVIPADTTKPREKPVGERVVCHRGRRVPRRRGAVLPDVNADDVKALMTSCLTRTPTQADPKARDRMVAIATRGIRTP